MNIQEIKKLLEMFDNSNSVKLKLINENFEILLEKNTSKAAPKIKNIPDKASINHNVSESSKAVESTIESSPKPKNANTESILSPMVGTFYRAPSPDSAPYVNIGDKVKKGQTIAIIEAMKIMNEIEAEFDCKIIDIVVSNAQSVEFSTELFIVEKI